jgi:hypothetical protein
MIELRPRVKHRETFEERLAEEAKRFKETTSGNTTTVYDAADDGENHPRRNACLRRTRVARLLLLG